MTPQHRGQVRNRSIYCEKKHTEACSPTKLHGPLTLTLFGVPSISVGEQGPVQRYKAATIPSTLRAVHSEAAIHQNAEWKPAGAPLEPATGPGQTQEETSLSKQALQEAPCPTGQTQRAMKEMQGVI